MKTEFITKVNERIANVAVSASAMRNQGESGIVQECRTYFVNRVKLTDFFNALNDDTYEDYLNKHTRTLMKRFGGAADNWGAARKALNLYFRDVVYNRFLSDYYGLSKSSKKYEIAIQHLEVPLDRHVGIQLCTFDCTLPKWVSIKSLKYKTSKLYQKTACEKANDMRVARVHLDLLWWRNK